MLYVGIATIWLIVIGVTALYERITGKKVRKGIRRETAEKTRKENGGKA